MVAPRMAGLYDLMLILDPNAPDGRHEEILAGVRQSIEADGTLVGEHDWGTRHLAYEIDHRGDGRYHLVQFQGEPALLERLDRSLKIADGVLRFRVIRLKPGSPPPPTPRPETGRRGEEGREERWAPVAARAAADAPSRDGS